MATKTRYKSPSPSAAPLSSGTMTLDTIQPLSPPSHASAGALSSSAAVHHHHHHHQQYQSSLSSSSSSSSSPLGQPANSTQHLSSTGKEYHHNGTRSTNQDRREILLYTPHHSRARDNVELPILSYHNAVPQSAVHFTPSAKSTPLPVILPPVITKAGQGHVLGESPANTYFAHYKQNHHHHHHHVHHHHHNRQTSSSSSSAAAAAAAAAAAHDDAGIAAATAASSSHFGYILQSPKAQQLSEVEKPRSLSIQSLITSPGLPPPQDGSSTRKRKGSDGYESGRATRSGSVTSNSVSIEDPDVRDAVEGLRGLKADFTPTSPIIQQQQQQQLSPPTTVQVPENEPFLDLLTARTHPFLSTAITTSLRAYSGSKSYSPSFRYAAESVENRVGLPVSNVVSAVGRRTGLEGVLRRGLQRSSSGEGQRLDTKKRKTNRGSGKGGGEETVTLLASQQQQQQQQQQEGALITTSTSTVESDQDNTNREMTQNRNWQTRLMLSTSGLGVALSPESLKSLKYCLELLRSANIHLGKLVQALKSVVEEWEHQSHVVAQQHLDPEAAVGADMTKSPEGGGFARILPTSFESRRVVLVNRIEGYKAEITNTMKKVMHIVSKYTGPLPEGARAIVKRHLYNLPLRFRAAAASSASSTPAPSSPSPNANNQLVPSSTQAAHSPVSGANRVLVLAKEGLDMMQQVSQVIEGTIVRAEEWCDRLGKKRDGNVDLEEEVVVVVGEENQRATSAGSSSWSERKDGEGDVQMAGTAGET